MISTSRSVRIEMLPAPVWEMVCDLVERPLKYMPLAVGTEVVRHEDGQIRSAIHVFGFRLAERVRVDEIQRVAVWVLEDNPDWSGYREIRVAAGPKRERLASATLTLTIAWTPLSEKARRLDPRGVEKLVEDATERWKALAESCRSNEQDGAWGGDGNEGETP